MVKKKILVGNTEEKVLSMIKQIEHSNIPYNLDVEDAIKQSSEESQLNESNEEYELFFTIEVHKEDVALVEAIITQHATINERDEWRKKVKKSRRKENIIMLIAFVILLILLIVIEIGKEEGGNIVSYTVCFLFWLSGITITIKYYKELRKESESSYLKNYAFKLMFFGIGVMIFAISSFFVMI